MKRMFIICILVFGLILSWNMISAEDEFFVIPVKKKNYAPVEKTGAGDIGGYTELPNEDATLQMGVAWPIPRFTDNDDGTVTDNLTELIWLKNANCFGQRNWATALSDCNTLNSGECGLTDGSMEGDWRLPNIRELQSLIDFGYYNPALSNTAGTGKWTENDPFTNVYSIFHWSATTATYNTLLAMGVYMYSGNVDSIVKTSSYYVWPVRGGN